MKELLLVIPAYNEEKNIESVIDSVREHAHDCSILVVDDGSGDDTYQRALSRKATALRHKVNLGLGETVRTGMKYALQNGYSYVLQFDGDGQHDASAIGRMLESAVKSGSDIIIGSRYLEKNGGPGMKKLKKSRGAVMKTIGRVMISACIRLTGGSRITDPTSGMRMYSRRVCELFAASDHYMPEPDTLAYLIRRGMKVSEIPVTMTERKNGTSYLDITESIRYMFRMCTSILFIQWFR